MALKNVGASVRARLLGMAQDRRDSFEGLLVRYVHERLLYRLGRSEHASRFALWHGDPSPDALAAVFRTVCRMKEADGVAFDAGSVTAEPIREHQSYVGVRIVLRAKCCRAQMSTAPACGSRWMLASGTRSNPCLSGSPTRPS